LNENRNNSFAFLKEVSDLNMHNSQTSRKKAEKKAFRMKLAILIISAAITVTVGFNADDKASFIALVLSSILTILTGIDQFLGTTTRHIELKTKSHYFTKLSLDMQLHLEENKEITVEKYEEFKKRFDELTDGTSSDTEKVEAKPSEVK